MKLIEKYNINEEDLYTIGVIEAKKASSSFFEKEKLKAKSLGILKPYNVKFMDLGNLLSEIKKQDYHANQILIDKYGNIDIETKASSMGLKYVIPVVVGIAVFFYIFNTSSSDTSSSSGRSACECSERWLATPKSMMKSTDKWKYDECVRKYGGWAGANDACIKSK